MDVPIRMCDTAIISFFPLPVGANPVCWEREGRIEPQHVSRTRLLPIRIQTSKQDKRQTESESWSLHDDNDNAASSTQPPGNHLGVPRALQGNLFHCKLQAKVHAGKRKKRILSESETKTSSCCCCCASQSVDRCRDDVVRAQRDRGRGLSAPSSRSSLRAVFSD